MIKNTEIYLKYLAYTHWVDKTGSTYDESGQEIISGDAGSSNHMYLAYRSGFFDGALIGIVDSCFGSLNTVDIGVGNGERNYLIAISSPLLGDGDTGTNENECGAGSVVLEEPGRSAVGTNGVIDQNTGQTTPITYSTTEQGIIVFPNSDDQYAIKITGTGINPLSTDDAKAKSSSFDLDTETLGIPKIRIGKKLFQTTLTKSKRQARSTDNTLEFIISDFEDLGIDEFVDAYRATYNPGNQQVLIPRVTVTGSGKSYSVILQYHAATNGGQASLEVISAIEIL